MDSRLHKLWCRPWTFSDCWPNTAGLDLTYNLKVKHYFPESSILETWTHINTTVTLTSRRWCFSRIGTRVPKTCGSLWQSDVSFTFSIAAAFKDGVDSCCMPQKICWPQLSRILATKSQGNSPAIPAGYLEPQKEGHAAEGSSCQESATLAIAGSEDYLSSNSQNGSRHTWLHAGVGGQERRQVPRERLFLQSVECHAPRYSRRADQVGCRRPHAKGAKPVRRTVENRHLWRMDGQTAHVRLPV